MNLEAKNISKSYGSHVVLKDISFKVNGGEIYCLLGKNGSGKSTLLNILSDLIKPDKGIVLINGYSFTEKGQDIKQEIGVQSQYPQLIEELNFFDYLELIGTIYNVDSKIIKERVQYFASYFFNEEDKLTKVISKYSSGMKQKTLLCATLLHKPNLLFFDEPFAYIDNIARNKMYNFFKSYVSENKIIFFTSNNLTEATEFATHVGIIKDSSLIFDESLKDSIKTGENIRHIYNELLQPEEMSTNELLN